MSLKIQKDNEETIRLKKNIDDFKAKVTHSPDHTGHTHTHSGHTHAHTQWTHHVHDIES